MPGLSCDGLPWCQAGDGTAAPRLAGQSYEYLVEAMRRFAEGERKNNDIMTKMMAAMSPADREAMARYLSGL
jgi:cytochrome c553